MKEIKGKFCKPNILGTGGTSNNKLACDDLGNGRDYVLSEVDANGAVIKIEGRYQRVQISNLIGVGVEVHLNTNNHPRLKPGEQLNITVGSQDVTITGEDSSGVKLNGEKPTLSNDTLDKTRYPW